MRRALAGVVCVVVLGACGKGSPSRPPVPVVVQGGASTWPHVLVQAGGHTAEVGADLSAKLTPLLATRAFTRPEALTVYGLDRPQAQLDYRGTAGRTAVVVIGGLNFDRHFFYAQRPGRATVYLVAADALRPVVALVGIDVAPPQD